MKKCGILILAAITLLFSTVVASATPMTSFEANKIQIDLGAWYPSVTGSGTWDEVRPNDETSNYDGYWVDKFGKNWNLYGGITYGVASKWGIQYQYHGLSTKNCYENYSSDYGYTYNPMPPFHATGSTQELNVLYSVHPNVAVFVGYNHFYSPMPLAPNARGLFQGGIVAQTALNKNLDLYGTVAFGTHNLFTWEAGLDYKLSKDWSVNVGYRYTKASLYEGIYEISQEFPGGFYETGKANFKGVKLGFTGRFNTK